MINLEQLEKRFKDDKRKILISKCQKHKGIINKIAIEFGVTRSTIYNWLSEYDININQYRKKADR